MSTERSEPRIRALYNSRVLLGGFLGGLISNVSGLVLGALVLHAEASKVFQAMENPPSTTRMLVQHVLMRFGIGLAAAWLYGAIRPRFGRGKRAIVAVAAFLWVTTYVFSALILEELRIYSIRTAVMAAAWGFVELVLVVTAVAWVCRDGGESTAFA